MFDCTSLDSDLEFALSETFGPAAMLPHVSESLQFLERAIGGEHAGRIAAVSSFGAESAVLLALLAEVDPSTPVLFVDTGQHFAETLDYRDSLAGFLGLTDVRSIGPTTAERAENDPQGELWAFDADACCRFRKVTPLDRALVPFTAWITGRKRHQALTRTLLPVVEHANGRVKFNPLAGWSAADVEGEMQRRRLPRHPLSLAGYPSIGCATCTRAVAAGADPRSGRWSGTGKTECGIHRLPELTEP